MTVRIEEATPRAPQAPAAGQAAGPWERVASSAELRENGPLAVSAAGTDVVVVRARGRRHAVEGRCPHPGALRGAGGGEGVELVCRNHRWRFDLESGCRRGGPQQLRRCPLREAAGAIEVDARALADVGSPRAEATRALDELPGPPALPVVGNAHQIDTHRLHLLLEEWVARFGPTFRFRIGPKVFAVFADPAVMEPVLRARPETYRRVSTVETIFEELGVTGVFSAEGASWRPQRRLAMESLAQRHLRGFYPALRMVADRLRRRWLLAAEEGRAVDVLDDFKRFTVDVTTLLVFGHDTSTLDKDDDVIQRELEHFFPAFNRRMNAVVPYWRYVRLPADRRVDEAAQALRSWIDQRIAESRERLAEDPTRAANPANFLEAMLTARDESGQPFSNDALYGNAITMLLAGEDTTANTLAFAVHELCESPDARRALRAELARKLGSAHVPRDVETANDLVYTGAIANEAMRLRAVAPLLMMEPTRDVVIGDVAVPRGTVVTLLTRLPSLDDAHFAHARAFRPERWTSERPAGDAHDPSVMLPFGSGPRICPGRSLALLEMKVVLATIYRTFELTRLGAAKDVSERFAFTVSPTGLRVRLSRRPVAE